MKRNLGLALIAVFARFNVPTLPTGLAKRNELREA